MQARTNREGVPPEATNKIFEPFFTPQTSGIGMGMGLSISRTIIQAHNGRLWAENNPELVATFWFAVPAHDEQPGTPLTLNTVDVGY